MRSTHHPNILAHSERPDASCIEQNTVGDESESQHGIHTMGTYEPQNVTLPIILHSSVDAITIVCDEVRAMDLLMDSQKTSPKQKQTFALRNPRIWVPTPKIGTFDSSDRGTTSTTNKDDRMLHPHIFKQIQKFCNYTFTLDACANSKGDNALCSQ